MVAVFHRSHQWNRHFHQTNLPYFRIDLNQSFWYIFIQQIQYVDLIKVIWLSAAHATHPNSTAGRKYLYFTDILIKIIF